MNPNSKVTFDSVIDLTESCLSMPTPRYLSNTVIDLLDTTDESFNISADSSSANFQHELPSRKSVKVTKFSSNRKRKSNSDDSSSISSDKRKKDSSNGLGDCPICWDRLGKNPLCSTKCGHVYCLKCLERSLKIEKKCPTCRRMLKGTSGYHPLYF